MGSRAFKDRLYAEFATIGKALASPHRLELLDLLGQGERSVDELAQEAGLSLANASAHLQVLRQARMVEFEKRGLQRSVRQPGLIHPLRADTSRAREHRRPAAINRRALLQQSR